MIAISKSDLEKQRAIIARFALSNYPSQQPLIDGLLNLLDKLLEGPGSWIHREEGEVEEGPSDEAYIETARELYQREGETEIDDGAVVSRGSDPGAYVQAWVWVYESDVTGIEEEES